MRRRLRRVPPWARATVVAVVLILALGGTVAVGVLALSKAQTATTDAQDAADQARDAAAQAKAVANCVNNVLADRGKVSDTPALIEEAQAQSDWSQAVLALFSLPPHPTPAQGRAEAKAFLDATSAYSHHLAHATGRLNANAKYRAAHPLGKC